MRPWSAPRRVPAGVSGLGSRNGHIELDHPVESIHVGHRHRRDLGDLTELVESIRDMGMLQPITISPEGVLICGARRLAAAKQLGLRRVNVWVRAGISTPLQQLLAEQHDNTIRKSFSPSEAAGMYRELKALMAEDAARRQEASRFGSDTDMGPGPADSAAPSDRESRAQAARLVSGHKSYTRFEQVLELQRIASDPDTPGQIRQAAVAALDNIDVHGKVNGHYQRFKAAQAAINEARQPTQPCTGQQEASGSVVPPDTAHGDGCPDDPDPIRRRQRIRAFQLGLDELAAWTTDHDPVEIGQALNQEQWTTFDNTVTATVAFADVARHARQT